MSSAPAQDKVVILDFGSQYTQLIARRVRELNIFCEIYPYNKDIAEISDAKAIILSGSPCSVNQEDRLDIDVDRVSQIAPVLGVCYGAQYIADYYGGTVAKSKKREYGRANISMAQDPLWSKVNDNSQVWMSHADTILNLPDTFEVIANTGSIPIAAYRLPNHNNEIYGIQFHPEVTHSSEGLTILSNFLIDICEVKPNWSASSYVDQTVSEIKSKVGGDHVLLGISGGVDSTVAALLINKAIGNQLTSFFINNGLLRKNEFDEVLAGYKSLGLNVRGIDASEEFLTALNGISDPEQKRKIIGKTFVDVFLREADKLKDIKWLAQGTIYPDVIESVSVNGPSATIKSHHNVGGLPDYLDLSLLEPLRMLFKDEVRRVGRTLGLPDEFVQRHPFPGPGLAIRVLGELSPERIRLCQEADHIYINLLKEHGWYDKIWQAGAILLPVKSVGVMGVPYELLALISNEIINSVKGINRVVYDISSKPPATIEWE